jgi:predicted MFS family arabinose efflux permease
MTTSAEKLPTAMLPAERRAVVVIALVAMIRMFGLFALLPVLALYAGGLPGATPTLVGLAVGGYGLTQAALQLPLGALSDRLGRLPVILGGLALFAAGSLVAAESSTIEGVIAGRFLQGAGAISATLTALLADATREAVRTRTMAVLGIGIGSSFLLALIAGPAIAGLTGVQALFRIAAGAAAVAALLLVLLPRGIPRPEPRRLPLAAAFRPALLRLDLYVFLLHALLTGLFVALPFLLRNHLDLDVGDHWKLYIGALVLSLAGTIPMIVADEHKGRHSTITLAIGCLVASMLILAFAPAGLWFAFAAMVVFFAGFNFLEAGLPARLSILAAGAVRGASLGVFSSSQFLGAFAGGVAGGRLLSGGNPRDAFIAGVVLTGLWLLFHGLAPGPINPVETPEN